MKIYKSNTTPQASFKVTFVIKQKNLLFKIMPELKEITTVEYKYPKETCKCCSKKNMLNAYRQTSRLMNNQTQFFEHSEINYHLSIL